MKFFNSKNERQQLSQLKVCGIQACKYILTKTENRNSELYAHAD